MLTSTQLLTFVLAILPALTVLLANREDRTALGNGNQLDHHDVKASHLIAGFTNLTSNIVDFYYIDLVTGEETPYNCSTFLANKIATSPTNTPTNGNLLMGYDDPKKTLNCSTHATSSPLQISLDHDLISQIFLNSE